MTEQNTSCLCSHVDLMKQSKGVCLSEVHTLMLLGGSHGSSLNIVLVLHSNISDFTRLRRDLVAGKLGLLSIFGAHQNDL